MDRVVDAGHEPVENRISTSRALRVALAAVTCLMALAPLVARELDREDVRFQWRMFSTLRYEVVYEVEVHGSWLPADLSGLNTWERATHHGDSVLRTLCRLNPPATAARRTIVEVVREVEC
jgi:hypothetical protein